MWSIGNGAAGRPRRRRTEPSPVLSPTFLLPFSKVDFVISCDLAALGGVFLTYILSSLVGFVNLGLDLISERMEGNLGLAYERDNSHELVLIAGQ